MFESAKLKIERADHHIADLERQFETFVKTNPHTLSIQNNPKTGDLAVRIRFKAGIPRNLALIIGDTIHNLRTALDHMTWEMIGRDGGTQDRYLKFPTGSDQISFESSCKGIETPSQSVIDTLIALEVFPTGKGKFLYAIHLLDNADKHTVLMPVIRATKLSKITIVRPDGTPMITMTDNTFIGGSGPFTNITNVPPGMSVELDNDSKATPEIFFRDVEGFPSKAIIPTLRQISHATTDTIDIVARSMT